MTMAIENHQQRHPLGGMPLDHMPYSAAPQFSNPWAVASTGASGPQMYPTSAGFPSYSNGGLPSAGLPPHSAGLPKQQEAHHRQMSLPYASGPPSAHYASGPLAGHADSMQPSPADLRSPYDQAYNTSAPPHSASYAPPSAGFPPMHTYNHDGSPSRPSMNGPPPPTQAFGEALDGARGMVQMSQTDITPRNIYGPRGDRGSTDSYGFPAPHHSAHSSISSASSYPAYFGGSVDSSATDYSSATESIDSLGSRTLPRPTGLMGAANLPPVQQSMMGSFNSKVSSSTQKKHKCKVCDKRFTRPSSLQTHMYSHTGEKPFACEVSGCGRNFSVVSNLRRHRKVHKDSRQGDEHDHGSPEGSWASSTRD